MAATVETVSRVGPCEAQISLIEIRDVRETKRKKIIERAAELLKQWDQKSLEQSEIEEKIDKDIKLGEIITWGPDKLPAGPDVDKNSDLIIVEGRADVLNLLRIGIKNTIAVQGTQIPKSVIELVKEKENITCFLDGDRGGTIVLNELMQLVKLDYIARAPNGHEVEELTRKQMIKALQNKRSAKELKTNKSGFMEGKKISSKEQALKKYLKKAKIKNESIIIEAINTIETGHSIGFSKSLKKLFNMTVGDIFEKIKDFKDTQYLIIDGILTKRLLTLLINMKIRFIACKNKEEELQIPEHLVVFYF